MKLTVSRAENVAILKSSQRSLAYMPALDGVRAIAVIGVVLAHFKIPYVDGGVIGVDVFFVLSGFLITKIIYAPLKKKYFIKEFYWRRFTRLFPPLLLVCLTYSIVGLALMDKSIVLDDVLASVLYVANWTQAFGDGAPLFLGHTWSLAAEEQFYIVWPVLLAGLMVVLNRRWIIALLIGAVLSIVFWRHHLTLIASYDRIYFSFDTRSDGMLIGCLLAICQMETRFEWANRILSELVIIPMVLIVYFFAGSAWSYDEAILVNLTSGWLVLGLSRDAGTIGHRLLARSVFVYIGKLSYSIYLWHFAIYQFLNLELHFSFYQTLFIGVPASFVLAVMTYHFIEVPSRHLRDWPSINRRAVSGQVCFGSSVVMMGLGLLYFQWTDIVDFIHPKPFAVVDYTPQSIIRGSSYNPQPDGRSVMWIGTSIRPPYGSSVEIDGARVTAYAFPKGFAALIPSDILDTIGVRSIKIDGPDGRPLCPPITLTVTAQ